MTIKSIRQTTSFKKDYKKYFRDNKVRKILNEVLNCIVNNVVLDKKYNNHPLQGEFKGCFDCHIMPDIILIYQFVDDNVIELIRIGSHSDLF